MNPKESRKWLKSQQDLDLDSCLQLINVCDLNDDPVAYPKHMKDWFCVSTEWGVVAYFASESEALSYQLNYINRILNK